MVVVVVPVVFVVVDGFAWLVAWLVGWSDGWLVVLS